MKKAKLDQKPCSCRLFLIPIGDWTITENGHEPSVFNRGRETLKEVKAEAKRLGVKIVNLKDFAWKAEREAA